MPPSCLPNSDSGPRYKCQRVDSALLHPNQSDLVRGGKGWLHDSLINQRAKYLPLPETTRRRRSRSKESMQADCRRVPPMPRRDNATTAVGGESSVPLSSWIISCEVQDWD